MTNKGPREFNLNAIVWAGRISESIMARYNTDGQFAHYSKSRC